MGDRTLRRAGLAAGVVAGAGLACVAWGLWVEHEWYALRRARVPVLDPGEQPLAILHLSDLHLRADDPRKQAFLAELAGEPCDLVVVTGDVLGEPGALAPALAALGRFQPRLGAVAVLGSNDYYAPRFNNYLAYFAPRRTVRPRGPRNPARELVAGMERQGWLVLSNRRARLDGIELAGLDDPHIRRDDLSVPTPPGGSPARLRLGVVHSPYRRALNAFERNGYDLILAGHTHGGQVRVPGVGALVTNCDLPRRKARGLSRWGSSWLHVSAGLGTSKYAPFRFACRPEATLLEVTPLR